MRVELKADELHLIKQAVDQVVIKGKDAPVVAKLISKIDNAYLEFTGDIDDSNYTISVYAINYNVLRIMSGMGGLAY